MGKKFFAFLISVFFCGSVMAAGRAIPDKFINKALYENIYPSTINQTKNDEKFPIIQSTNKKNSNNLFGKRGVVKRTNNAARAANNAAYATTNTKRNVVPRTKNVARSANTENTVKIIGTQRATSDRKVAARGNQNTNSARSARLIRNTTNNTSVQQSAVTSQRCFADYKTCMDSYCDRSNTAYDRCYCSAKLAQIDSKYKNKIDSLIQQIIKLKYNADATDEEIKTYWDETVGVYTGTNPWVNLDNALNIDWADTETRFRGQNAFTAGHTYCVNHLRACSYMASNLRDAYKSEIERDCASYEKSLERIQMAAESVIETYND
jgi:hypothetical protein